VTPAETLRKLCALRPDLPDSVAVTFPLGWLSEAVSGTEASPTASAGTLPSADYTVKQLAERFDRRPSTIRAWLESGRLRGYRFGNREWRATADALREFEEEERQRGAGAKPGPARSRGHPVNLSAWRTAS
jgi:excisionase family DNA binding protein